MAQLAEAPNLEIDGLLAAAVNGRSLTRSVPAADQERGATGVRPSSGHCGETEMTYWASTSTRTWFELLS